ncbi:four helix bundle protein [Oscillatoriales cyanobacterium LEGE 11467]|uniref:Four helix bundle protein n=1 Tax=Zarconia navalis LEGE 11467 TaxID=1828826 RepID=A0A928VXR1_9CYAN|nr:four helix bundle protein [Zarconia navalis]MBE9040201.1 four helix bundle protein [Zarconia navalis LEGE 11467]
MNHEEPNIQERTLQFAVRIVKLCKFMDEQGGVARVLYSQLIRSGTSIGANVREAQSAESDKDFRHKLEIALKEARETHYWLVVLVASDVIPESKIKSLMRESDVIIRVLVSITKKLKDKQRRIPKNSTFRDNSEHRTPNSEL